MKLHLGCGNVRIRDYENIDLRSSPAVDKVCDIVKLSYYKENTIDEIYACNVLEHLGRFRYRKALERWYELLKKGGILRLSVPDIAAVCEYYVETRDLESIYSALYAGQNEPWNFHYWCWDFYSLKQDLEEVGFGDIKRWSDHPVRDWSINYLPYHDEKGNELPDEEWFKGKFIALNVIGIK